MRYMRVARLVPARRRRTFVGGGYTMKNSMLGALIPMMMLAACSGESGQGAAAGNAGAVNAEQGSEAARVALLIRLEAKPGKEADVASFLEGAVPLVQEEPGTTSWFAIRTGPSTYGIFD